MADLPPPLLPSPSTAAATDENETSDSYTIDYECDFKKFLSVALSMRIFPKNPLPDYHDEFSRLKTVIVPQIKKYLEKKVVAKVHVAIFANFFKLNEESGEILETKSFHLDTKSRLFYQDSPYYEKLDEIFRQLSQRIEQKLYLSSNYIFEKLIHADVIFLDYQPIRGYSYIRLPKKLVRNRYLINIKNQDELCLPLSITAALLHEKLSENFPANENRGKRKLQNPWLYLPHMSKTLNFDQKSKNDFSKAAVDRIEFLNDFLSVNVYIFDEERNVILPYRISNRVAHPHNDSSNIRAVDLLLIHDASSKNYHYVVIKNLTKLCQSFHTRNGGAFFLCRMCLSPFSRPSSYEFHQKLCDNKASQAVFLPAEGEIMEFQNGYKGTLFPFVIFADFECLTRTPESTETTTTIVDDPSPTPANRTVCNEQIPYAYGLKLSCVHEKYQTETILRYDHDKNLKNHFFEDLKKLALHVSKISKINHPLDWSEITKMRHLEATSCDYCGIEFDDDVEISHADHDHLVEKNNFRYF